MIEQIDALSDASRETEERGDEREVPAHRPEQVIEETHHGDITHHRDEIGCETQPE